MWTWEVSFYDAVSDKTFLVSCPRHFWTAKEAEDDMVMCCDVGAFTQNGVPITANILSAEVVFLNETERHGD